MSEHDPEQEFYLDIFMPGDRDINKAPAIPGTTPQEKRSSLLGLTMLDASKLIGVLSRYGFKQYEWRYPAQTPDSYLVTAFLDSDSPVPDRGRRQEIQEFVQGEMGATAVNFLDQNPDESEDGIPGPGLLLIMVFLIHWS